MSRLTPEQEARLGRPAGDEWRDGAALAERVGLERVPSGGGMLLLGLAAVGLGFLAWYYLGPDLKRYMKIRNM
jgi:hypothetical protein